MMDVFGIYCFGILLLSFVVNNIVNGGLFVEKVVSMSVFANFFEIFSVVVNIFDLDVYIFEVRVFVGVLLLIDLYLFNCMDGGNFFVLGGCIIGFSFRGYFNNVT